MGKRLFDTQFAIGRDNFRRSTVWRSWGKKSDVYLAAMPLSQKIKFSFHGLDYWSHSYTRESNTTTRRNAHGVQVKPTRVIQKLVPVQNRGVGIYHPLRIRIPHSELTRSQPIEDKLVELFEPPGIGCYGEFEAIFFDSANHSWRDWLGKVRDRFEIVVQHQMPFGTYFIIYVRSTMDAEMSTRINVERNRVQLMGREKALLAADMHDGSHLLIELNLKPDKF